jgi:hypothetical protein
MNPRNILALGALLASAIARSGNINVAVSCPLSVSYGTGDTMLSVDVEVTNPSWDTQVLLKRYAVLMFANPGQIVTGLAVYGPFAKLRSEIAIPPSPSWPHEPVSMRLSTMKVPNVVGTLASLHVEFLSENGHTLGGDDCLVRIVK